MVPKLHFHRVHEVLGASMECNVISLMSVPVVVSEPAAVLPKPKHSMLPLLVVLFLISYGLMAVLVVEQGQTIESQRTLIRQLFSDSTELSAMKGKAFQDKRALEQEQAQAQAQSHGHAQTQVRPQPQGPITQVVPQSSDKNKNSAAKFRKPLPPKPSEEGQEMADERRSLKTI
jgi:hypothetical protein